MHVICTQTSVGLFLLKPLTFASLRTKSMDYFAKLTDIEIFIPHGLKKKLFLGVCHDLVTEYTLASPFYQEIRN